MAKGGVCQVVSLEEQLSRFPPELLDCTCTESHLDKLVHTIDKRSIVSLATNFELLPAEIDGIQSTWPKMSAVQRLETFKTWQQKNNSKATYRYARCFIQ